MINNNKPDLQQVADSFGGTDYSGLKKDVDKGYKKFCEKRGMKVGWQQGRGGFDCKNREKES